MINFFDNTTNNICNNVVTQIFPNLIQQDQDLLTTYLFGIINFIALRFNFDETKKNKYILQFTQNNNKDLIGFLLMLLPYITDDNNDNKIKLKSLNDLYIQKTNNVDINNGEPKYTYTNLQYGRCKRVNDKTAKEIPFNKQHLDDNYELLKDTISQVSNKLYVNWVNVRPYRLDYFNTPLFKLTNDIVMNNKLSLDVTNSIHVGEMYNILTNYVYKDILNIKWILYDVYENNTPYKFLYMLNKVLNIENCIKDITNNEKTNNYNDTFNNEWETLVDAFITNKSVNGVSYNNIELIMKSITSYGKYDFVEKSNEYLVELIADDIDVDDNKNTDKYINNIKKFIKDVKTQNVYNYLLKCFRKLSQLWYGKYYLDFDKNNRYYVLNTNISSLISRNNNNFTQNQYVTIKYIYNYSKALCHTDDFVMLSYNWKSIDTNDRSTIVNKLNNVGNWFNIGGILKRRGITNINIIQNEIHTYIKSHLTHIIFNILMDNGLLTEFVVDDELLDNNKIVNYVKKNIINGPNKQNYENSTYFIDNLTYGDHNIGNEPYLTSKDHNLCYITMHAMNYVSQINTFHRYLNNRVIYITGGTGQGKSTQMPKLLLYAMKMCDYKTNGIIGCTAPRINAVTGNADTISTQMGIPINQNNYNIQYNYKDKKHENNNYGLKLRILTDGVLVNTLDNNKLLKYEKPKTKIKNKSDNIYDIIIVDEAHEHNTNMDLILTNMRHAAYFNNDIKLIIMSATMDDDEPIYRRYYRMINDNKMYPLSIDIKNKNLDRINVDRRIHISPPGLLTQYKINDIYRPNQNGDDIVIDIINNSTSGDILLFQPGENDIIKSVTNINMKTMNNPNVIAIPYYSKMDKDTRKFIEDIPKNMNKFYFDKSEAFAIGKDNLPYNKDGNISYKRVIIVSTNIAEASITIETLRYVVDTGIQKVNTFKEIVRVATLDSQSISESSRMQRRGRVGRVAPGTVYYTYEEGTMANIKRPYGIAISNLKDSLFNMLCDIQPNNKNNIKPIFDNINDPNMKSFTKNDMYDVFVKEQYFIGKNFNTFYSYIGKYNNYDYDYDLNHHLDYFYEDGYTMTTLMDYYGKFYIIHPNELCFQRNILGNIVNVETSCGTFENNKFISTKLRIFFDMLREELLIVYDNNDNAYKTKFGKCISDIKQLLNIKDQIKDDKNKNINVDAFGYYIIPYVYSVKYECDVDMIKYLVFVCNCSSIEVVVDNYNGWINLYGNMSGDFEGIIKLFDGIIMWYDNIYKKNNLELNIENINIVNEKYKIELEYLCKNKYLKYEKIVDLYKFYVTLLLKLKKVDINKIMNYTPLLIQNYKYLTINERAKICLIQSYPDNLLQRIAILNNEYFYVNLMNPSINNIYQIKKLNKPQNTNCTFIKKDYISSVILYINKNDVTYIENININIIAKLLPLKVAFIKKRGSLIPIYKQEMENYVKTIVLNNNEVKYDILNNYEKCLKEVESKLLNNYDPNILSYLSVIGDSDYIKDIVKDNGNIIMVGGNGYYGIGGNKNFVRCLMNTKKIDI